MASSLTPAERTLRARLAAHEKWANHDAVEGTAKARAAFLARFEDECDPDRVLPELERKRRAEHARKAYFTRLALASSRARRKKALNATNAGPDSRCSSKNRGSTPDASAA